MLLLLPATVWGAAVMALTTLSLTAWVVREGRGRLARRALLAWAAAAILAPPVALAVWLTFRPGSAPTERLRFGFLRAWVHVTALVAVAGLLSTVADLWLGREVTQWLGVQRQMHVRHGEGGLVLLVVTFWLLL